MYGIIIWVIWVTILFILINYLIMECENMCL